MRYVDDIDEGVDALEHEIESLGEDEAFGFFPFLVPLLAPAFKPLGAALAPITRAAGQRAAEALKPHLGPLGDTLGVKSDEDDEEDDDLDTIDPEEPLDETVTTPKPFAPKAMTLLTPRQLPTPTDESSSMYGNIPPEVFDSIGDEAAADMFGAAGARRQMRKWRGSNPGAAGAATRYSSKRPAMRDAFRSANQQRGTGLAASTRGAGPKPWDEWADAKEGRRERVSEHLAANPGTSRRMRAAWAAHDQMQGLPETEMYDIDFDDDFDLMPSAAYGVDLRYNDPHYSHPVPPLEHTAPRPNPQEATFVDSAKVGAGVAVGVFGVALLFGALAGGRRRR